MIVLTNDIKISDNSFQKLIALYFYAVDKMFNYDAFDDDSYYYFGTAKVDIINKVINVTNPDNNETVKTDCALVLNNYVFTHNDICNILNNVPLAISQFTGSVTIKDALNILSDRREIKPLDA